MYKVGRYVYYEDYAHITDILDAMLAELKHNLPPYLDFRPEYAMWNFGSSIMRPALYLFVNVNSKGQKTFKDVTYCVEYSDLFPRNKIELYYSVPEDQFKPPLLTVRRPIINREFDIKKVIFSNSVTIICWADGTKTIVRCQEGDTYDPEKGMAMAIAKRALGTNKSHSNFNDIFSKWLPKEEKISVDEPIGKIEEVNITDGGIEFKGTLTKPVSFVCEKDKVFPTEYDPFANGPS